MATIPGNELRDRLVNRVEGRGMTPMEFGEALIRTEDLDPVYCGLVRAGLPEDQLQRWLLAYWCFYHMGVASYLSEAQGDHYWTRALLAAANTPAPPVGERWPRGTERRHFRGTKAVAAVQHLANGDAEAWVRSLYFSGVTANELMRRIEKWPMFGPWIAFKAADMVDRCLGEPVQFPANLGIIYSEPRKALHVMVDEAGGEQLEEGQYYSQLIHQYERLLVHFRQFPAPPAGDRPCGPQEVETVLCKWKSYRGGHYHVGKDIHECRGHLRGWGETAARILAAMPQEVAREQV